MATLNVKLLGGFEIRAGSGPALTLATRKSQALFAYLVLHPGYACPREKLTALLWGDTEDTRARQSLRQGLFSLRKALGAIAVPRVLIERETIALDPSSLTADVISFEQLLREGTPDALDQAMALYRGDLLEGLIVTEAPFEE